MLALQRSSQASPDFDRRGALRHPVAVEGQLSAPSAAASSVVLTDISELGCQIIRPVGLTRDTSIGLSFGGFTPFSASVVWTSTKAAGLRFDHPIHPALVAQVVAAARGRRRAQRQLASGLVRREERERLWHLALPVSFAIEGSSVEPPAKLGGELSNLSVNGCRIASDVALLPATTVTIEIDGHQPLLGLVRWCVDQAIGVEFCDQLSAHMVESIAAAATNGRVAVAES